MQVYLAAVQARLDPGHYKSEEAFAEYVFSLLSPLPKEGPKVVAFPELFGLPLLFWWQSEPKESLIKELFAWAKRAGPRALLGPLAFYRERARAAWPIFLKTMARAAREHGAYLFSGTWFAPRLDEEPSRGLVAKTLLPRNWGFWLNPKGRVLARPEKTELMPQERLALVRPGSREGLVVKTRLFPIATLICLDAFFEGLVELADQRGARVLVQPSANPAPWTRPWPPEPNLKEGEAWRRYGLLEKLRGRENLLFGVNPMLTGELYDLTFEGKSSVVKAGELLAEAKDERGEELVGAWVEL